MSTMTRRSSTAARSVSPSEASRLAPVARLLGISDEEWPIRLTPEEEVELKRRVALTDAEIATGEPMITWDQLHEKLRRAGHAR